MRTSCPGALASPRATCPAGRQVQWAIRRAKGPQTLYYRAVVYKDPQQAENDTTPPFPVLPVLGEPLETAVQELAAQVRQQSADPASFTVELLKRLAVSAGDQNVGLLLAGRVDPTARARAAVTVLAAAQIPARLMHGISLVDRERQARLVPWLEVHDGDRWLYFDPANGAQGLPEKFLTWWRGDDPLYTLDGGADAEIRFSVQRNEVDPVLVAERRAETVQSRIADFSLFSLPIQTQAVYAVLMMIPLGALVVVILRNIVGVTTFGTFMPVLVALSFRETQVLAGVILFSLVVTLGLLFRFFLENLRLLLVPRLASVLIIVVLLMALISIVSNQLGIDMGLSVGLFPDGHPDDDHRAHVDRVGGTRPCRGHPAGRGQPRRGGHLLHRHGHRRAEAPVLRLPRIAALGAGHLPAARALQRLQAAGAGALQVAGRVDTLMFSLIRKLHAHGVLGLNERNCQYIMRYNPRHLYPLVDDKLATKRLAMAAEPAGARALRRDRQSPGGARPAENRGVAPGLRREARPGIRRRRDPGRFRAGQGPQRLPPRRRFDPGRGRHRVSTCRTSSAASTASVATGTWRWSSTA